MTPEEQDLDPFDHTECIEYGRDGGCAGDVAYRESLTGTGMRIIRCDRHWEKRLDLEERLRRDYPDSPNPPSWFDPLAAGETWDVDA